MTDQNSFPSFRNSNIWKIPDIELVDLVILSGSTETHIPDIESDHHHHHHMERVDYDRVVCVGKLVTPLTADPKIFSKTDEKRLIRRSPLAL